MCKYHTPALPSHEVFYIILGTKKMTTRRIYSSKLSLLFAGKSKAASRGRQDRGRPSLMQPAQTARQQRGGEKRENKSENIKGRITDTVKQCSARLNEPRRCAAPKLARCRDGQQQKTPCRLISSTKQRQVIRSKAS